VEYIYPVTMNFAVTANATTTALVLKPASAGLIELLQWDISFDGSAAGAGIRVQITNNSTDGTGTASPPTPQKFDTLIRAAQFTMLWKCTVEPAVDNVIFDRYLQPFGGLFLEQFPLGRGPFRIESGNRFGFRLIAPSNVAPNCCLNALVKEG
jgi:hypothetical protein